MIFKFALGFFLVLSIAYFAIWVFNHINPWAGIAIFVLEIVFLISYLNNKTKQ